MWRDARQVRANDCVACAVTGALHRCEFISIIFMLSGFLFETLAIGRFLEKSLMDSVRELQHGQDGSLPESRQLSEHSVKRTKQPSRKVNSICHHSRIDNAEKPPIPSRHRQHRLSSRHKSTKIEISATAMTRANQ